MSHDDDMSIQRPLRRVGHELGADLTMLAADELTARIALLQEEIARLEAERDRKSAGKRAAEDLFRK